MHNCLLTGLTLRMVQFGGVSVFESLLTKSPCRNPLCQNLLRAYLGCWTNLGEFRLQDGWTASFRLKLFFVFFFAEVILAEEISVWVLWLISFFIMV